MVAVFNIFENYFDDFRDNELNEIEISIKIIKDALNPLSEKWDPNFAPGQDIRKCSNSFSIHFKDLVLFLNLIFFRLHGSKLILLLFPRMVGMLTLEPSAFVNLKKTKEKMKYTCNVCTCLGRPKKHRQKQLKRKSFLTKNVPLSADLSPLDFFPENHCLQRAMKQQEKCKNAAVCL